MKMLFWIRYGSYTFNIAGPLLQICDAQLSVVVAAWRPQIGNLTWASYSQFAKGLIQGYRYHAMTLLESMMWTSQWDDLVRGNLRGSLEWANVGAVIITVGQLIMQPQTADKHCS